MAKYHFIQGKIYIHSRQPSKLSWGLQKPIESVYFQCFIQSQLFSGNFCAVHCQPADQIRAIYIEKNQQKTIVGLCNCTQQILHLHPRRLMFSHISMPRLFSNFLQLSGFLLIFSIVHFQPQCMAQFIISPSIGSCGRILFHCRFNWLNIDFMYMHRTTARITVLAQFPPNIYTAPCASMCKFEF
ncbi:hypothetical protein M5F00_14550 [Acinetobacter sp. ANC 4945]|uniref:Uncharacterized protein n=1 Tax=Acinetobacter amyesii TaxID=2942470 RepID=A0A1T1H6T7_9GAMM|nr:hypothetical protein [Acinetobacter amyesii]MCL6249076.1 hypothetical protein [Acinetobacter amyesii]OOV85581.1 hypothetical protein B1202_02785 [Acinetobacter amyesii]